MDLNYSFAGGASDLSIRNHFKQLHIEILSEILREREKKSIYHEKKWNEIKSLKHILCGHFHHEFQQQSIAMCRSTHHAINFDKTHKLCVAHKHMENDIRNG